MAFHDELKWLAKRLDADGYPTALIERAAKRSEDMESLILDYAQEIESLKDDRDEIKEEASRLRARVAELKEISMIESIRKEAFIAGYFKFASQVNLMNSNEEIQERCDIAYKEWRDATKTTD